MDKRRIAVIGGGPAGIRAALLAAARGAAVTLYERDRIGGRCLWEGCLPVKALLSYAKVRSAPPAPEEWRSQCRSIRSRLDMLSESMSGQLRAAGVTLVKECVSPDALPEADAVLIAAGCVSPALPAVEGKTVLGPEGLLSLPEVPASLAVVGAGPAGMELCQIFAALGSAVTVYEQADAILPGFPAEGARALEGVCREAGIRFRKGVRPELAALPQSHILLTVGGQECAFPRDAESGRVLFLGDAGGRGTTAYEAELEAERAVAALWGEAVPALTAVPRCVCGLYDLVTVGESSPRWGEAYSDGNGYAFLREEMSGFVRLYAREDGTLCGAELLLPGGAELASLLSALIRAGASAETLAGTAFFHPSHSEILRRAAMELL
ncbi:MAG: NAD(P)/FAD-dependent oxidoreductase [Oscillospiraceae bacterium]|nr:NAD(P)/FAD-dependent oxidoreductase [Oscillospiraceae bacterium]